MPYEKYFNDPRPLAVRYRGSYAECGATLKKAHQLITGLLIVKANIYPGTNQNTANSSQQQLIKKFTRASAIHSLVDQ